MPTDRWKPGITVKQTTTGHALSEAAYLDARFRALQPEYEQMLRSVGVERGWHVLDAGCGGGSHLPLLSALVGSDGRISAIDATPENMDNVTRLAGSGAVACPIDRYTGSVCDLPLADGAVDAVWCANVSIYLSDDELERALDEFRRVTRRGGVVAIKDVDAALWQIQPLSPTLMWHTIEEAAFNGFAPACGALRTATLGAWLRAAGLIDITITPTPIVRRAPLSSITRQAIHAMLELLAQMAAFGEVDPDELRQWQAATDPHAATYILNHPDFCWFETQTVLTGRVP